MKYIKISGNFSFSLEIYSHPPNFKLNSTSFYIPALLGLKYLPALLISFAITDLVIGYHTGHYLGECLVIGLISQYFYKNINLRLLDFIRFSNFFIIKFWSLDIWHVWISFEGLTMTYIMAIPFFYNTLLSTAIYSALIEFI